jgi:hypothetical protein
VACDTFFDTLLTLKSNHKKTYRAVTTYFHDQIEDNLSWRDEANFFDAFDLSHGRTVRRRVWRLSDLSGISDLDKWQGLRSIVVVERIRQAHHQANGTSDGSPPKGRGFYGQVGTADCARSDPTCPEKVEIHL